MQIKLKLRKNSNDKDDLEQVEEVSPTQQQREDYLSKIPGKNVPKTSCAIKAAFMH